MEPPRVPCPVCGAYSITQEGNASALLAVCDVLVIKALEHLGMKMVRRSRERFHQLGDRPFFVAHILFPPSDGDVAKVTRGAWDIVPPLMQTHGCCEVTAIQVTQMLDEYVHDLAITGTAHSIMELAYRFRTRLGLPVWLRQITPLDPTEPVRTRIQIQVVG